MGPPDQGVGARFAVGVENGVEVISACGVPPVAVAPTTTGPGPEAEHSNCAALMFAVMSVRCYSYPLALTWAMIAPARGQYVASRGPKAANTEK